ncbi:MAG: hypothetical protein WCG08_12165 [Paludibacter sp.]
MSIFSQESFKFRGKIDESHWKKLPIKRSEIDLFRQINEECPDFNLLDMKTYKINNKKFEFHFLSCDKYDSTCTCKKNKFLSRCNLVKFIYWDGCDASMNYGLYKNAKGQTILLIDILIPETRWHPCSEMIGDQFLVEKDYCPSEPIIYIRIHNLDSYEIKY